MTVIVNAIWGGRFTQVVDRQISRPIGRSGAVEVIDSTSTKVCVVLCGNALLSIAYTGVALAQLQWMDAVIASCLAHRPLAEAMVEPGAIWLARPVHTVINELALNLNRRLNSDAQARGLDLRLSIVGWHLGRKFRPLSWEVTRGQPAPNGMRYFNVARNPIGKFLRQHPKGLSIESLGDPGLSVDGRLRALEQTVGYTHDDVERHIVEAIGVRATETLTVGADCLAVQLDPIESGGQAQFTYYPAKKAGPDDSAPTFITGWVLTERMICSPGTQSTFGSTVSACGRYVIGGFSDGITKLHVRSRLPSDVVHHGGPYAVTYAAQTRARPT